MSQDILVLDPNKEGRDDTKSSVPSGPSSSRTEEINSSGTLASGFNVENDLSNHMSASGEHDSQATDRLLSSDHTEFNDFQSMPQTYESQGATKKDKEGSKFLFLLQKFTLYETKTHFYIVGSNARETRFRIMEIDLTASKDTLSIKEIGGAYNRIEVMEILGNLEDETKSSGGLTKRLTAWGIMGFIRFTEGYYILVITKRSCVALIGGHYVYHIDATQLIPLVYGGVYRKPDRRSEETRYLTTFQNLDLSKTFYFSYTYDITHTLQQNMIREKKMAHDFSDRRSLHDYNEMFVWNNALLKPVVSNFENAFRWYMPVIHGFIDQAKISVSGRSIYVTIIARRSHYFAGARFLKRGVNDQGRVANEVETEQIVADINTTSFHDPRAGLFNSSCYTSYVQHRGSIPLFWSQDVNNMSPKPPIELNAPDPFFASAALHFDDMFKRYGPLIRVLNLIKTREKNPRETKLLFKFNECVRYLNQFLPEGNRICYKSWDMSRASKSRDQDVIEFLEKYADETLQETGFFHNGRNSKEMKVQMGVCRTNCIDCLDRTNAAQFVIGKKALGYQLHALNVISDVNIDYDSDAVNLLTEMFHDHGDTIALQYGGSHLVNTMETYRKINQWSSHSRDMIESIRRFYSNSFVDSQRQDAINLFLGNFVWEKGQPMLWDLTTDYYLHNRLVVKNQNHRSYLKWWTPSNLEPVSQRVQRTIDAVTPVLYPKNPDINELLLQGSLLPYRGFFDNYWNEYYKPRLFSSFQMLFAFNMNSTLRYVPPGSVEESLKLGPFKSRKVAASHRTAKPGKPNKDHNKNGKSHSRNGSKKITDNVAGEETSRSVPIPSLQELREKSSVDDTQKIQTRNGPRKSESSTKLGALVQASRFYKNPSIHRFLTEPGRLSGKFLNIRGGTGSYENNEMNSSLGSLEKSNTVNSHEIFNVDRYGDSLTPNSPYIVDNMEEGLFDKPLEETLESLVNPSVTESARKTYEMYADYEVEFTVLSSEPVTVDHPDYAAYTKAISPEETIQRDIPIYDTLLYEHNYEMCTMGPPRTLEPSSPVTSLEMDNGDYRSGAFSPGLLSEITSPFSSKHFEQQFRDIGPPKYVPKGGELGIGESDQVVSMKDVDYYNEWIQHSGSI